MTLLCPIAATAPRMMEASAAKITICCHWPAAGPIASIATRIASATADTFDAVAKNAVTGVGAPS